MAAADLFEGTLTSSAVSPREVMANALKKNAASLVFVHNHPSGNLKPSEADIRLTKNLAEAGRVLEIQVLDHLIVSQKGYYSFADEGRL